MSRPILFYISAGHGGNDPGAVAGGYKEKDMTLYIAKECYKYLQEKGYKTILARATDYNMPITTKTNAMNKLSKTYRVVAIDIHINAGGGDGAEVIVSGVKGSTKNILGKELAGYILDEVKKAGQNSRGIKTRLASNGSDYFGFIRQPNKGVPVIFELGFIDNVKDRKDFDTKAEQKKFAKAIGRGCIQYYKKHK